VHGEHRSDPRAVVCLKIFVVGELDGDQLVE
jgi:hypothetical protein